MNLNVTELALLEAACTHYERILEEMGLRGHVRVLRAAVEKVESESDAGLESEQTAGARSEDVAETERAAGSEKPAGWVIGATRRSEDAEQKTTFHWRRKS